MRLLVRFSTASYHLKEMAFFILAFLCFGGFFLGSNFVLIFAFVQLPVDFMDDYGTFLMIGAKGILLGLPLWICIKKKAWAIMLGCIFSFIATALFGPWG